MNIIYKITYLPHVENKTPPFFYIGSKYHYDVKYMGSPSSKQQDWYTGNLTIRDWWKKEVKEHPELFRFDIIETHDEYTPHELVEAEKFIHLKLDVKLSPHYFNKSIATTGWVSIPRTEETKQKVREITQTYWATNPNAVARRQAVVELNKKTKSKEQRELWSDPVYRDKQQKRIQKSAETRRYKIHARGQIFGCAKDAALSFDMTTSNVYARCKNIKMKDWYYVIPGSE